MAVDVTTTTHVSRAPEDVAAFASDPSNAPLWYANIESVRWRTPPPLAVGSRVDFVARFLGRTLSYTYEVVELDPRHMVMRTAQGPFPMETVYTWDPAPEGGTQMSLRNHGEPTGFARVTAAVQTAAIRRANQTDLARLRALLETGVG